MRAARLLHMLMILQNRGRQSCGGLARMLEVSRRTVLRDIDALTEAGLPMIVHRGALGGVEIGFDFRSRLTGLDNSEADAMAILFSLMPPELHHLGLAEAGRRAQAKLREALPEQTRARIARMDGLFPIAQVEPPPDPRRRALAEAVMHSQVVRLRARSGVPVVVHPTALVLSVAGWALLDGATGTLWPEEQWDDVNISGRRFTLAPVATHRGRPARAN